MLCYVTRLSRWVGLPDVVDGPYEESDPFTVRFHVRPAIWLPIERTVPIYEPHLWDRLSFTCGQSKVTSVWTGKVRGSLAQYTNTFSLLDRGPLSKLVCTFPTTASRDLRCNRTCLTCRPLSSTSTKRKRTCRAAGCRNFNGPDYWMTCCISLT